MVVTPDEGGGPVVAVYRGKELAAGNAVELVRFFGIQDDSVRSGARAVGDVTGDGIPDIVVSAGFLGGPRIQIWDGIVIANRVKPTSSLATFFAFEGTLRNVLSALGCLVPPALAGRGWAADAAPAAPPVLRLRSFEDAVHVAFSAGDPGVCRVEVGHSELIAHGVQGCHNARPFAGRPTGYFRIIRAGTEPGPLVGGVRLYVATVDVALTAGREWATASRPLDFALLPPAPVVVAPPPVLGDELARRGQRAERI